MATTPPRAPSAADISPQRRLLVDQARQSWIRKLIDLSRRNNLLYFRPLKTGTLELSSAPGQKVRDLLTGESVAAAKLAPHLEDEALNKLLRDISRSLSASDMARTGRAIFHCTSDPCCPRGDEDD